MCKPIIVTDIEQAATIESMGTWESEKYNCDVENSYDLWSFCGKLYSISKSLKIYE